MTLSLTLGLIVAVGPVAFGQEIVLSSICGDGPTTEVDGRLVCDSCKNLPAWVKKHPVRGDAAKLGDGYFVYAHGGYRKLLSEGLFVSPIRTFQPRKIPGTERAYRFAISECGQWIAFLILDIEKKVMDPDDMKRGGTLWLVRPDGTGLTQVPVEGACNFVSFVRNSPLGTPEVLYTKEEKLFALAVNLSGAKPAFAEQPRLVANYGLGGSGDMEVVVSGNRIFSRASYIHNPSAVWMTIPDGGKGTAEAEHMWMPDKMVKFQCGHTMAQDGSAVAINPGTVNESMNRILVLPFREPGSPEVQFDKFVEGEALSSNWEPVVNGDVARGLFNYESFTNDREQIILRRHTYNEDGRPDQCGIYMLHWPSNTWTLLSSPWVEAANVTAHFYRPGEKPPARFGDGPVLSYGPNGAPPAAGKPAAAKPAAGPGAAGPAAAGPGAAGPAAPIVELEAVVVHTDHVPRPKETVYRNIVLYVEYEVKRVIKGSYTKDRIVVGHWGLKDYKLMPAAEFASGQRQRLRVERLDGTGKHEKIAREQTLDTAALDLDRYWALEAVQVR